MTVAKGRGSPRWPDVRYGSKADIRVAPQLCPLCPRERSCSGVLSPKSGHSRNPSSSWMSRSELGCHEVNATRHLGHFFISAIQEASAQVRVSTILAPALAPPAVRRPRTSSTILPPGDLVVSVHDTQDWRCNGMRLQTPV